MTYDKEKFDIIDIKEVIEKEIKNLIFGSSR